MGEAISISFTGNYSTGEVQREFTRLLIPILAKKIRRTMPALLNHPSLLAHTIYQTLSFDEALKDAGFGLLGTLEEYDGDLEGWKGTSDIILGKKEWFDAWLEGERKCKRVNKFHSQSSHLAVTT